MVCRLPSSSRYWNRSCPGRSWHALTIFATRRSLTRRFHFLPLLPLNSNRSSAPFDLHVRVAQGGEPVALVLLGVIDIADADERVLQEMDDRRQHLFARQTAQAHVLGRCVLRIAGSACAKASMCSYFVLSRTSRKAA